jgi:glutathione S-transferase
MLRLHFHPGNASFAPHVLLRELGAVHELVPVDRAAQAHKSPAYLKLNPNGLIPVLEDGDLVLYETAAILLHLADTHPGAGLAPALGTPARAELYKWLFWLSNTLQATLIHYFYPERMVEAGNADGAAQVKAAAEARVGTLLDQLDALLADGRTWLLGEAYGVADPLAFMLCRWTRGFGRPARERPHLRPWLERVLARPATREAFALEGLQAPWF